MADLEFVHADWPCPAGVHALTTTRIGGASAAPFDSLNLGDHVGDEPEAVARNRAAVTAALELPGVPRWLNQVHGTDVATGSALASRPAADAAVTTRRGEVLAILTADCLPIVLCERDGAALGVAHAGWRSLAGGVVANTIAAMDRAPGSLMAWFGPAIGPTAFEVGDDVRGAFAALDTAATEAFTPGRPGHWWCDLYALARAQLAALGVHTVYGGGLCTVSDASRFFSYRRDGACGRMATLLWRDAD